MNEQERYQRAVQLFLRARALAPSEREALLREACADDAALDAEVRRMLAAEERATPFEQVAGGLAGLHAQLQSDLPSTVAAPIREGPGTIIGRYKLLQKIGEGGFGVVFMAEQLSPVVRRVALKIIKLGMDTRQVIARFEQERQALALMDHPNIAKVLDAGATEAPAAPTPPFIRGDKGGSGDQGGAASEGRLSPSPSQGEGRGEGPMLEAGRREGHPIPAGRPYFVMEYVKGDPITAFADAHKLNVRDRLDLFTQVCQAVQHAHMKGVIHRDLKPGNVLVNMTDGRPHAKVIDFGIAKATGARLTDKTLFTEHRQLIGTPEYMSPEQAEGSPDIDTRTDVYALGVLLYELLTGATPFDAKRLRSAAFGEMQRIIKEEEPPAPSLRLSRSLETLAATAAARQAEPGKLGGLIKGELDWIVMKALDKDRARRYESPNQFAADVQRHLKGEPVVAAPPSVGYRVRKFVRRHKGPVIAGGAVTVALLLGAVGTTVGMLRFQAANRVLAERAAYIEDQLSHVLAIQLPGVSSFPMVGQVRLPDGRLANLVYEETKAADGSRRFRPTSIPLQPGSAPGAVLGDLESVNVRLMSQLAIANITFARERGQALETANAKLKEEVKRARLAEATSQVLLARYYFMALSEGGAEFAAEIPKLLKTAVATRSEVLGPTHPETLKARWALVGLCGQEDSPQPDAMLSVLDLWDLTSLHARELTLANSDDYVDPIPVTISCIENAKLDHRSFTSDPRALRVFATLVDLERSRYKRAGPKSLALLAMTQFKLGDTDAARATLAHLRVLMSDPAYIEWSNYSYPVYKVWSNSYKGDEAQELIKVAEELIEGAPASQSSASQPATSQGVSPDPQTRPSPRHGESPAATQPSPLKGEGANVPSSRPSEDQPNSASKSRAP